MKKIWFITGSSRGLGRKITEVALGNGDLVAATALGKDDLNDVAEKYKDQVLLIELNVTDKSQIENAIEETVKRFGRIDVLVNNAGFGITGAAEAYTDGEVKSWTVGSCRTVLSAVVSETPDCLFIMLQNLA
jgi:NAD(P)-dependent dehydrogenase (short-subunit alcohol dehydrogenase family)